MLMAPKKSGKKKAGQFTTSKMGVAPVKRGGEMEEIQFEEFFCLLRSFSLGLIRHCLLQSLCGAIFPTKHFWADSSWIPKRNEHAGLLQSSNTKARGKISKRKQDQSITWTTRTVKQILSWISPLDWRKKWWCSGSEWPNRTQISPLALILKREIPLKTLAGSKSSGWQT